MADRNIKTSGFQLRKPDGSEVYESPEILEPLNIQNSLQNRS